MINNYCCFGDNFATGFNKTTKNRTKEDMGYDEPTTTLANCKIRQVN